MALENMTVVIFTTGSIKKEEPVNYSCVVTKEEDKLAVLRFMIQLEEKKKKEEKR